MTNAINRLHGIKINSLRSKRFRAVSEQRKIEERDSRFWAREKQHGNACYAG